LQQSARCAERGTNGAVLWRRWPQLAFAAKESLESTITGRKKWDLVAVQLLALQGEAAAGQDHAHMRIIGYAEPRYALPR
jgi:hypothetical protein